MDAVQAKDQSLRNHWSTSSTQTVKAPRGILPPPHRFVCVRSCAAQLDSYGWNPRSGREAPSLSHGARGGRLLQTKILERPDAGLWPIPLKEAAVTVDRWFSLSNWRDWRSWWGIGKLNRLRCSTSSRSKGISRRTTCSGRSIDLSTLNRSDRTWRHSKAASADLRLIRS